nr:immunoglobulin light chain junction region [Macaca mulatta]MOV92768.1 immunoglobulin light chain junction region [Macaca mulatta]MOV92778.1 immunoglobulin light chain junction region [Macaca mulatta]MOV92913.1 immunoglobulin light chain junction region [Macaca mulatta]MOV93240.1 immunoglobulin light chain junction region [Macaca mulatta]
CLQDKELPLSF